jgi:hypothetical protein
MTARFVPPSTAAVLTWVDPSDRPRVDAAGSGIYRAMHHDSVDALYREVRRLAPAAVLMSVGRPLSEHAPGVARLVREFPRVPMVALLSRVDQATPHAVLNLGNCGIRTLVDVRDAAGWHRLREFVRTKPLGKSIVRRWPYCATNWMVPQMTAGGSLRRCSTRSGPQRRSVCSHGRLACCRVH